MPGCCPTKVTISALGFLLKGQFLATAYSDPKYEAYWGVEKYGTGEHEPMAVTVRYGKGQVFGTPMGHVDYGAKVGSGFWPAMDCVGFSTLIQRGAEWAATGKVTQKIPEGFPTAGRC